MKFGMFREVCIKRMTLDLVTLMCDVFLYLQFFYNDVYKIKIGRMRTERGEGSGYFFLFFLSFSFLL